jgi:hypothetical protein
MIGTFVSSDSSAFAMEFLPGLVGPVGPTPNRSWLFSVQTTDIDPGAGQFRIGNTDYEAATYLYVDNADSDGNDATGFLDTWDDSTSVVKGTVSLVQISNPTQRFQFRVTGAVVNGTGYRKVPVEAIASTTDTSFDDGEPIAIGFAPAGDAGSLTSAGAADLQQNLSLSGDLSPPQITSNQNDYSPTGLSTATVLRLTSDAARDITGIAGGTDGRILIVGNDNASAAITLKDAGGGSTGANRFSFGADVVIPAKSRAIVQYDSTDTRWKLIAGVLTAKAVTGDKIDPTEVDTASAATTSIGAVDSLFQRITGTTTITSFGTGTNKIRFLRFAGALTLTHNGTSLDLPVNANITTAAGDTALFVSDGSSNWRCVWYTRENGRALTFKTWTVTKITASDSAWAVPAGTTEMLIEGWGGGGSGGSGNTSTNSTWQRRRRRRVLPQVLHWHDGLDAQRHHRGGRRGRDIGRPAAPPGMPAAPRASSARTSARSQRPAAVAGAPNTAAGGSGGSGSGGDENLFGQGGGAGFSFSTSFGGGGYAPRGGYGAQLNVGVAGGDPGGGGAAGNHTSSTSSGAGGNGYVIIRTR